MDKNQLEAYEKEFQHLQKEMEEKGYADMAYPNNSKVEIDGILFSKIISAISYQKRVLIEIEKLQEEVSKALDFSDQITLDLMRKHYENCENGITKNQENGTK